MTITDNYTDILLNFIKLHSYIFKCDFGVQIYIWVSFYIVYRYRDFTSNTRVFFLKRSLISQCNCLIFLQIMHSLLLITIIQTPAVPSSTGFSRWMAWMHECLNVFIKARRQVYASQFLSHAKL